MANELTKEIFARMLAAALAKIEENFDYLNKLDSATGDGDHGTAILSTMKAAVAAADVNEGFSKMLSNIGWGIMSATGGSTSSLTGAFYLGMSNAFEDEVLSVEEVAKVFKAGLDNVKAMTTAKVGDKTIMDAMIPAADAMTALAEANPAVTLSELFAAGADAAQKGAESTVDLVAKQGRAKNLGERSRGFQDAGATSFAILMRAYADAVAAS
ncbi:MAG: DAK2 domain-containing protein [Planctomycetia bacterium]|nr:DAK2 domain-containing protein [Planctomycetia bacterium]